MIQIDPSKGEKVIRRISLSHITVSHNPRNAFPGLSLTAGTYTLPLDKEVADKVAEIPYHQPGDGATHLIPFTPLEIIHAWALSLEPEKHQRFCDLIEKYEPSVVQLAASRLQDEIEPVILRSFRVKVPGQNGEHEYIERYGIVAGERRIMAAAYNYAKHGPAEGRDVVLEPTVGAICRKLTVDEASDLAFAENAQRLEPSAMDYARYFHDYTQRTNESTGRHFNLREIAAILHMDYQFVRGREALAYLSDEDKARLEAGKLNVTDSIKKGLAIKQGKDGKELADKKDGRRRALNLAQIESLFDDKWENHNGERGDEYDSGYFQALADVMGLSRSAAIAESKKRIDSVNEAELAAARKVEKTFGRRNHNGKAI